jgi:hypothetical protein
MAELPLERTGTLGGARQQEATNDELLVTGMAASRLRHELDQVPLWRGDHVPIKQMIEDFARYIYLPRVREPSVLIEAIRSGLPLLTWQQDSFAYAESFDEAAGRYRGLRCGQVVAVSPDGLTGLLVKPQPALKQHEADETAASGGTAGTATSGGQAGTMTPEPTTGRSTGTAPTEPAKPRRFHGSVTLDGTRVGRDASRIADEVISHLVGLMNSKVKVTLEIEADIPTGAPDNVVRTVTENSRTLKFSPGSGFEKE